jgi:hypothetical protein
MVAAPFVTTHAPKSSEVERMVSNLMAHCGRNRSSSDLGTAVGGLSIDYRPVIELKLDPKNPRSHSQKQIRQIAGSIRQFGFAAPILIDGNSNVIAGHGRLLAARQLDMREVPTICLDHLTPAQVRAYQIADNKLCENSTWNDKLLAEAFKQLSIEDPDFSLDITPPLNWRGSAFTSPRWRRSPRSMTPPTNCRRPPRRRSTKPAIFGSSAKRGDRPVALCRRQQVRRRDGHGIADR